MSNNTTYNPGYLLTCTNCANHFRMQCIRFPLAGLPKYCPYCGTANTIEVSLYGEKGDYWYIIAKALGIPETPEGADLVENLYELWDASTYNKFVDFVKFMREDHARRRATSSD